MLAQRQTEQSLSCAHFSKPEPFRVELNIAKKTITHETFPDRELLYPDFLFLNIQTFNSLSMNFVESMPIKIRLKY